jgi:hypothetical protein
MTTGIARPAQNCAKVSSDKNVMRIMVVQLGPWVIYIMRHFDKWQSARQFLYCHPHYGGGSHHVGRLLSTDGLIVSKYNQMAPPGTNLLAPISEVGGIFMNPPSQPPKSFFRCLPWIR